MLAFGESSLLAPSRSRLFSCVYDLFCWTFRIIDCMHSGGRTVDVVAAAGWFGMSGVAWTDTDGRVEDRTLGQ